MEAASLKEPSSSLESARPFPEIFDVNGFSIFNLIAEFNQMAEKQYQRVLLSTLYWKCLNVVEVVGEVYLAICQTKTIAQGCVSRQKYVSRENKFQVDRTF